VPGGDHLAALPNKVAMAVNIIARNWTIRNAIALAVPWVNGSRLIDGKAEVNDGYGPDMLCRLAHRHHSGTKRLI
jgi:hypothetical protein